MLENTLEFKRAAKIVNNKFVKVNLYLVAHNVFGFDSYVVFNNLAQWRTIIGLTKNGSGIVSLKIFNGYVDQAKKNSWVCSF